MSKRLFVAIPVNPDLRRIARLWQDLHQDLPVRWIQDRDFHITLISPWQDENSEEIISRLQQLKSPPFLRPAQFDKIVSGPSHFHPRLVWAIGHGSPDLFTLKAEIERVLNFRPDGKPFKLHLTLARLNVQPPIPWQILKMRDHIDWTQPLDRIALYESEITPEGVTYNILTEVACSHLPTL